MIKKQPLITGTMTPADALAECARVGIKVDWLPRKGLAESLESFAARNAVSAHQARALWHLWGLTFLNVLANPLDTARQFVGSCVALDGPRIAPGVAVATRPTWWETERVTRLACEIGASFMCGLVGAPTLAPADAYHEHHGYRAR